MFLGSLSQDTQRASTPIKKSETVASEPRKTRGRRSSLSERTSSLESVNEVPAQQNRVRTRRSSVNSVNSITEENTNDSESSLNTNASSQDKDNKKAGRKSMRLNIVSAEKEKLEAIPELNVSQEGNGNNKDVDDKNKLDGKENKEKVDDFFEEPMEIDEDDLEKIDKEIVEHNLSKNNSLNDVQNTSTQETPIQENIKQNDKTLVIDNKKEDVESIGDNDTQNKTKDVNTSNREDKDVGELSSNKTGINEDTKSSTDRLNKEVNDSPLKRRSFSPVIGSPKKYFLRNSPKLSDDETSISHNQTIKNTPKETDDTVSLHLELSPDPETPKETDSTASTFNTSTGSNKENNSQDSFKMDVTVNLEKTAQLEHLLQQKFNKNERLLRRCSTPTKGIKNITLKEANSNENLSKSLSLDLESKIISNVKETRETADDCKKVAEEQKNSLESDSKEIENVEDTQKSELIMSQSEEVDEINESLINDESEKKDTTFKLDRETEHINLNDSIKQSKVDIEDEDVGVAKDEDNKEINEIVTNADAVSNDCNSSINVECNSMDNDNEMEVIDISKEIEVNDAEDEVDVEQLERDKSDKEGNVNEIDSTVKNDDTMNVPKRELSLNANKSLKEVTTAIAETDRPNVDNDDKQRSSLSSESIDQTLNKSGQIAEGDSEKSKIDVSENIDKMIDTLISENRELEESTDDDDDDDAKNKESAKNMFIDDMAEVVDDEEEEINDEDDENILIDVGESIHSSESRSSESFANNSNDSFIVDDDDVADDDLLSGEETYLGLKLKKTESPKKKRSRIIKLSSSDSEHDDVFLQKLEASFKDITPDDIQESVNKSVAASTRKSVSFMQEKVTVGITKKKDGDNKEADKGIINDDGEIINQNSEIEIKSSRNNTPLRYGNQSTPMLINTSLKSKLSPISSAPNSSTPKVIIQENIKVEDIKDEELRNKIRETIEKRLSWNNELTPNKSKLNDISICNKTNTSLTLQQNVSVEEIKNYSNTIKDVLDSYYTSLKENNEDIVDGRININLSIDYEPTTSPKKEENVSISVIKKSNNVDQAKDIPLKTSPLKTSPSKKIIFMPEEPISVASTAEFNATILKDFYISVTSSAPYIFSIETLSESSDMRDYNVINVKRQIPSTINARLINQVMQFGNFFNESNIIEMDSSTTTLQKSSSIERTDRRKRKLNIEDILKESDGIQTRNKTKLYNTKSDLLPNKVAENTSSKVTYFPRVLLNKIGFDNEEAKKNKLIVTTKVKCNQFVTKDNKAKLTLKDGDNHWYSMQVFNMKPSTQNKTVNYDLLKRKRQHFDTLPEISNNDFKSKILYDDSHVKRVKTDEIVKKKFIKRKL